VVQECQVAHISLPVTNDLKNTGQGMGLKGPRTYTSIMRVRTMFKIYAEFYYWLEEWNVLDFASPLFYVHSEDSSLHEIYVFSYFDEGKWNHRKNLESSLRKGFLKRGKNNV